MVDEKLLSKYDIPTPRYTSYPTVPYWQTEPILENVWRKRLLDSIFEGAKRNATAIEIMIRRFVHHSSGGGHNGKNCNCYRDNTAINKHP